MSLTKVQLIRTAQVDKYHARIADWCDKNCKSPYDWKWEWDMNYYHPDGRWASHICFDNPEDATLFALAFQL